MFFFKKGYSIHYSVGDARWGLSMNAYVKTFVNMAAVSACTPRQSNIQILIISGFVSHCVLKCMCSEFPSCCKTMFSFVCVSVCLGLHSHSKRKKWPVLFLCSNTFFFKLFFFWFWCRLYILLYNC